MKKTSCGLVLGTLLIAVFSGYGAGCSSSDSSSPPAPTDASVDGAREPNACIASASNAPKFLQPLQNAGQCTDAQLSDFTAKCVGTSASQATCDPFLNDAQNAACLDCLFVPTTNTTNTGAFLDVYVNEPGYVSFVGGSSACVTAYHDAFICSIVACQNCADADACNTSIFEAGGECAAKLDAYTAACGQASDQAALDTAEKDVTTNIQTVLKAFCGLPSGDAGADAR